MSAQSLQVYFFVTTATMIAQQLALRSRAFRRMLGFPDNWPITPEQAAANARKSGDSFMSGAAPFFRRVSALAALDFSRALAPSGTKPGDVAHVGFLGLRTVAPPPPPDNEAGLGGVVGDVAAAAAVSASISGTGASSGAVAAGVAGRPTLLANRPVPGHRTGGARKS